jgi:pimeloyl-ACP methyl ester carboxylesterase
MMRYRIATVGGHKIFYREAGDPMDPVLRLLHGFPTDPTHIDSSPSLWHDRREVSRIFVIASSFMRDGPSLRYPHVLPEKMG